MRRILFIPLLLLAALAPAAAQEDVYAPWRLSWAKKAEEAKPVLFEQTVRPVALVRSVADTSAFQGWRMLPYAPVSDYYSLSLKQQPEVTVDFGKHLTGYFTFRIRTLARTQDAPIRLRFTFGEVPAELNTPFDPWKGGLSRAWMQDEIITVLEVDKDITLERRLSGRYLKIELLGAPPDFDFAMDDLHFRALTSAGTSIQIPEDAPERIRRINDVAVETLRECMQTVYEDGPKRDKRLWIGDLYLESIANNYSFRNHGLTKRCLYLLASLAAEDGRLHANVFETPHPHPQYGSHTLDYSLIYNVALLEYVKATGDTETARDLWPVVEQQVEWAKTFLTADRLIDPNLNGKVWLVFDWRAGFDATTSIQGLMIWSLKASYELAGIIGTQDRVKTYPKLAEQMKAAARKHQWDKKSGIFVSGPDRQVSYLSQVWMILSDVLSQKEAQKALNTVFSMPEAVYPGAPYAYHYLIEACVKAGLHDEARERLSTYWGGMVDRGADTYWEVYDPAKPDLSPYDFFPVNSYCHAWSCTPVYFIGKYPEIFLQ